MPALHTLILVCGPTAAGKTALVEAAVARLGAQLTIVPTVTSRPRRPTEAKTAWYRFVGRRQAAQRLIDNGEAIQWADYGGNLYVSTRQDVDTILTAGLGVLIVVEPSVERFRQAGYRVLTINVLPVNAPVSDRALARLDEDGERQGSIEYDGTIFNRWDAGGHGANFKRSVDQFCTLIRSA